MHVKINPQKVEMIKSKGTQSMLLQMGSDTVFNEMKNVGDNHCFVNEKVCFLKDNIFYAQKNSRLLLLLIK